MDERIGGALNFLFWNTDGKEVQEIVFALANLYHVDVLILAEAEATWQKIFLRLNATEAAFHLPVDSLCEKIVIFTRFPPAFLRAVEEGPRYTIRRICLPGLDEMLLVATHMPSQLHFSPESINTECTLLADRIRDMETRLGHDKTILVGDLNLNPFDDGVIKTTGFHATMSRAIARRGYRIVQKKEYPFFYNPMWAHMCDLAERPGGTYHYDSAEHVTLFWHTFDQVMVRPSLLVRFPVDQVKVIHNDGTRSLLNERSVPDREYASDHLPIFFRIEI